MDLRQIQYPEATSSASASTAHPSQDSHSATTSETKPIRSSARVKAAKQKAQSSDQGKDRDSSNPDQAEETSATPLESISTRNPRVSPTKSNRSRENTTGKGKARELPQEASARSLKRPRRNLTSTSTPLTISEPVRDLKGKKRAAPEFDEEDIAGLPAKRSKIAGYSLRSTSSSHPPDMPRKARTSTSKGKATTKSKMAVASSSRIESEDVEMMDAEFTSPKHGGSDLEEALDEKGPAEGGRKEDHPMAEGEKVASDGIERHRGDDDDDDDDDDEGDDYNGHDDDGGIPSSDAGPIPGGMDEATALAIFGDYRQFGSYMMSLSSRLKTMLNNIKSTADPTTRLVTLQELSELLSISTEDTLAGSFQVEQFVRELVKILGGRGADEEEDDEEDTGERDEDAALAAALALSSGGQYQGDENLEAQVLACRCLANLMEALPGVAHTVVYHGAIPVLCSKLIEISYIDLAEQTLSTLEKISEEFPSSIVREGGLAALLNYLDFFSIAVQRTALQAASNCCRTVSSEHFPMIRGVWPIIRNCLAYSDQRLVEFACLCVIRVIDSYHRSSVENLESLVDADLIKAVNQLLLPAGGSPLIAANTYTLLLRALATSARASPRITLALLEADIVDTLYQILTGVLPSVSTSHSDQGDAVGGQGLGGGLADMTVMENLAHRPKEQVEEALSLVSELLPPLPKDGVFDHKAYTEKSLARLVKAKAKADRAAARLVAQGHATVSAPVAELAVATAAVDDASPAPTTADAPREVEESGENVALPNTDVAPDRTDMLRSQPVVVARFMQLLVPILVDVYAASVITPVRIKTLTGLLKAVGFLDPEGLKPVLMYVPVASFASSILSSKDHPSLVIGALQLVDLLLGKLPSLYKPTFHREGVFHEIETLAERTLTSSKSKEKEGSEPNEDVSISNPLPTIPGFKKLSSLSLDPEDAITLRARVIHFKHLTEKEDVDEDSAFQSLRAVVDRLSATNASDQAYSQALWELADLFASPHTSVSSFELLKSGVVDSLLQFATDENRTVSLQRRKEILLDALTGRKPKLTNTNQTPFATLVKKLQESFTRMESFEVITVAQNNDDSKRSSPSLLARQLRLRLVAGDDSDIPRNLHNMVVSIHAIATFQALHDYLRPRVAGLLSGGSRLSGMFAALAASGFVGSTSRPSGESASAPVRPSNTTMSADATTASASTPSVQRRRSQRLAKQAAATSATGTATEGQNNDTAADTPHPPSDLTSSLPPNAAVSTTESLVNPHEHTLSDTVVDSGLEADFTDDEEIDAEVFDDEVDPDNNVSEKTITVSVAEDGSKIEAQTPEGTRVATPNVSAKEGLLSMARNSLSSRGSYAAALKAKPTDWHLEFSMDDHILPLDLTIYGAIHQHEMRKQTGATPLNMIWQGVYTIKFRKVPGPAPSPEARVDTSDLASKNRSPSPTLSSLPDDAPHAKILRLLRLLFHLNTFEAERMTFPGDRRNLPDSAFVNNKLTAKLTRQLEEPMIVASSCLPDWALDLPQHFPFLFPFATRYNFLQSTSFGYARLILKWQSQQSRGQDSSRRDEGIGFLGRLQRQKVRISRKHVLESAVKVFELYGSSSSILEVEYFEEVGTGLGPTLEFYSLVSKEFARKDLKLWRDADASGSGPYVDHPTGLYPAPISREDIQSDGGQKRTHILRVIGQFVAKAMLDSRIIDLSFNKIFVKLVLGEEVPLTIATLKLVDMDLANSLTQLQNLAHGNFSPKDKISQKVAKIEQVNIEDLALDFTIPGYDIELRPHGRDIPVTSENINEYVAEVLDAILGKGAAIQAKAFREGFSKVFPIADLRAFSADELVMLFGNSDEDWSTETLSEALKADHGFNVESRAIRDLIEIMTGYDAPTRRAYLQFITGSPKLPIGGFRGLNPPLTVVRKPHEAPLTADDYLPSVMTCVNYLKLPEYSSKDVMKSKLHVAMQEGVGSFHLS